MSTLLQVNDITKIYQTQPKPGLDHVSFDVMQGEFLGIMGASGSGKTTLLNVLSTIDVPTSGNINMGKVKIQELNQRQAADFRKDNLGFIFQEYFLLDSLTVQENIAVPLTLLHKSAKEIDKKVMELAELFGIASQLKKYPSELSGGQRQRVALGRAMVRNPAVFLLDEPLSNLDAKLRTSMRTEIIKLHKKLATTFIYVTHDQTEAMTMGDRIVVMKDGIIQQVDTPQNLYDMPCNMFVAGFIGSPQMNFLDGTLIKKGELYGVDLGGDVIPLPKEKTADGKLDSYVGKKVKMGIRPEDIDDEPEFMAKHPDCHLEAQVDVSEMMGAEIYLYLEYKGNKMTARVAPTSKARNGDTVRVAFDPHKVHLFDVETEQTILN